MQVIPSVQNVCLNIVVTLLYDYGGSRRRGIANINIITIRKLCT